MSYVHIRHGAIATNEVEKHTHIESVRSHVVKYTKLELDIQDGSMVLKQTQTTAE